MEICLTNLAKYNNGDLVYKRFDLPIADIDEAIAEVCNPDEEEYFITDYDAPFEIKEYDSLAELNEFAEQFDYLNEHEQDAICYLLDYGHTREQALDQYDEVQIYQDMNLKELAEEMVDNGNYGDIPESIKYHIDYESIAQELENQGWNEQNGNCYLIMN